MKYQNQFSGKNKKNVSICLLLIFLLRVLRRIANGQEMPKATLYVSVIVFPQIKAFLHALYWYAVFQVIKKTRLCNCDPLKPHLYKVKLGFTGICIIFLILLKKHRLWVLVRTASPRRDMKNIGFFYRKIFLFLVVKFSIYLNRLVFVMYFNAIAQFLSFRRIVYCL